MTDLQGGQVDLLCDQITTTLQPILTRRVKPYATTTRNRLTALPDVPTLIEQGMDDFEVTVWHGIYAPKNLPNAVSAKIVQALQHAVEDATFKENMRKLGALPVSQKRASPDGLATHLRNEVNRWSPVIKAAQAYID